MFTLHNISHLFSHFCTKWVLLVELKMRVFSSLFVALLGSGVQIRHILIWSTLALKRTRVLYEKWPTNSPPQDVSFWEMKAKYRRLGQQISSSITAVHKQDFKHTRSAHNYLFFSTLHLSKKNLHVFVCIHISETESKACSERRKTSCCMHENMAYVTGRRESSFSER